MPSAAHLARRLDIVPRKLMGGLTWTTRSKLASLAAASDGAGANSRPQLLELLRADGSDSGVPAPPSESVFLLSSRSAAFLGRLIRELGLTNVLEFGAGYSSLVLAGALSAGGGGRLTSVEEMPEWCEQVWTEVRALEDVDARLLRGSLSFTAAPQGIYPAYRDAERAVAERGPYDLVLIDAPTLLFGREGPLHLALPHLRPGALVVLDDAGRAGERWVLRRWLAAYDGLELKVYEPKAPRNGIAILSHDGRKRGRGSPALFLGSVAFNLLLLLRRSLRRVPAGETD